MSTNLSVVRKKGYTAKNTNGICMAADLIILKENQYWHMPTEMCTQMRCLCKRFMSISRSDATTLPTKCERKSMNETDNEQHERNEREKNA